MKRILFYFFLLLFELSVSEGIAQDLPTDFKVENEAQFRQSFFLIEKQISQKYDTAEYTKYRDLFLTSFDWLKKNEISNKKELLEKFYNISNIQKDFISQMNMLEFIVQSTESVNSVEFASRIYQLGVLNIMFENYPKALYYLNKFVQMDKMKHTFSISDKFWASYKELGYVYYKLGNFHEAIKCYKQFYNEVKGKSYYFEPSALNDIGQCFKNSRI